MSDFANGRRRALWVLPIVAAGVCLVTAGGFAAQAQPAQSEATAARERASLQTLFSTLDAHTSSDVISDALGMEFDHPLLVTRQNELISQHWTNKPDPNRPMNVDYTVETDASGTAMVMNITLLNHIGNCVTFEDFRSRLQPAGWGKFEYVVLPDTVGMELRKGSAVIEVEVPVGERLDDKMPREYQSVPNPSPKAMQQCIYWLYYDSDTPGT